MGNSTKTLQAVQTREAVEAAHAEAKLQGMPADYVATEAFRQLIDRAGLEASNSKSDTVKDAMTRFVRDRFTTADGRKEIEQAANWSRMAPIRPQFNQALKRASEKLYMLQKAELPEQVGAKKAYVYLVVDFAQTRRRDNPKALVNAALVLAEAKVGESTMALLLDWISEAHASMQALDGETALTFEKGAKPVNVKQLLTTKVATTQTTRATLKPATDDAGK